MKIITWIALFATGALVACTTIKPSEQSTAGLTNATSENTTALSREPAAIDRKQYQLLRGNPGEYDPGAPKASRWVELYGSAPNYREVGKAILGGYDEKFRWEFGPMWYRGRLGDSQVKVFVVGQEGAQDENVSNRAFTGSTGTKTQKFLNHIGIYRSYLFMNTFVYTISGQLEDDPKFNFVEQGSGAPGVAKDPAAVELSPIVQYRHRLFDNMLIANADTISLLMGVGAGGKASLATWINARGGKCSVVKEMSFCDASQIQVTDPKTGKIIRPANQLLVVGVPHPGGASQANGGAGALDNIIRGFTFSANRVAAKKKESPNWLAQDLDDPESLESRLAKMNAKFEYEDAGIPYRDFAYGTNWRMGHDGTTSNRWKADSIQVFSQLGVYGDKTADYKKSDATVGRIRSINQSGLTIGADNFTPGIDMPWEPPRFKGPNSQAYSYDSGPCGEYDNHKFFQDKNYSKGPCELAELMTSGWPIADGVNSPTFGPISVYRGRLNQAKTLVIADQTSHDDFFSGRALSGEAGQQLQKWLDDQRVGLDYAVLRTTPWDTLGAAKDAELKISAKSQLVKIANKVIDLSNTTKIVGFGVWAQKVAKELAAARGIKDYVDLNLPKTAPIKALPRQDLPYHSRWWMGTSGNRAARGEGGALKKPSTAAWHYYRVYAPDWNASKELVPRLDAGQISTIKSTVSNLGN